MILSFMILESGILPDTIRDRLKKYTPTLKGMHLRYEEFDGGFTIYERFNGTISAKQRRFYRGFVVTGYKRLKAQHGDICSPTFCHKELLAEFAPFSIVIRKHGDVVHVPKSTSEMTVEEMKDYITSIIAHLAENGVYITIPEDLYKENLER
jgi:hypothetical protein